MKKALIISGPQGSGKTTLAMAIARVTGPIVIFSDKAGLKIPIPDHDFQTIVFDEGVDKKDFTEYAMLHYSYTKRSTNSSINLRTFPLVIICTQETDIPENAAYEIYRMRK